MSEVPPPAEEPMGLEPKLGKPLHEWIRALIIVGICLVIMLVLVWTGNMRTRQAEENAYRRMGDAMAQALVPQFLNRNWAKTEQELTRMAEAGNFSEITITDPNGVVLASTTRTPLKPETLKSAPDRARVIFEPGNIRIERKVWLAQGNAIGAVRFHVRR
jgi:hypothetical protein